MDTEKQAELVRLYIQLQEATDSFHTRAEEIYEMAKRLEDLTKARAAFEQAKDLREALGEMGKEIRGES